MPLQEIEAPRDYMTVGEWVLEIEGTRYGSFSQLSGLGFQVGTIQRSDGGTNLVYKFPNNQKNYGRITLTRQRDPEDPSDASIDDLVDGSVNNATKYSGQLIKYHRGEIQFRIRFTGMLFLQKNYPTMNKNSGTGFDMSYTVEIDYFEEVPASA